MIAKPRLNQDAVTLAYRLDPAYQDWPSGHNGSKAFPFHAATSHF